MKATNPPRETVSSLSFRDAETTPTVTAPALVALAEAALALLSRGGTASPGGESAGDTSWTLTAGGGNAGNGGNGGNAGGGGNPGAPPLDLRCTGPDLPSSIPGEVAHPSVIPFERPWVATYRLTVHAPLIVLDLAWRESAPLRIMTFSRGDWEVDLVALAT
jgi:hypothetical protein